MKETNLCYLFRPGQVLLAMKKRGFGVGKWNGPGGKANPGESPVEALVREVHEEIGVTVKTSDDRGIIEFIYAGKPDSTTRCRIFSSTDFEGEPVESEEMRPQWFGVDAIPYPEMWESDGVWFPKLLADERVNYRLYFSRDVRFVKHEPLLI
ncbi:MAG: 8-oxo-dGTP diphosphatase [Patescibacteria group bacterium]